MRKGFIKNILLVFLISSSIILTFNIWVDQKLWPDGYNFFSTITQKIFGQKVLKNSGSLSKEKLALPKQLVINNASKRSVFFETSKEYDDIIIPVKKIFIDALKAKEFSTADAKEWNTALKAKSIFVSYPVGYDIQVLSDILGVDKVTVGNITIRDFIISQGDIASSNLYVYIKNYENGIIKKCSVKYDKKSFEHLLYQYSRLTTGDLPYSFELNFDKVNSNSQRVTISSDVLLSINRTIYNNLYYKNPVYLKEQESFDFETISTILKKFGYNPNTVRKDFEPDGTIVYVENYGLIKVHPSGYFEYKAISNDKGISLPVNANASYNEIFTASLNFVTDFWTSVVPQRELNLSLSSNIINNNKKNITFTMNYYANGTPIHDDIQNSITGDISPFGLTMNIVNGKIVSYKQLIRIYYEGDETVENISTIEALDKLFANKEQTKTDSIDSIKEIFPAYVNENGVFNITWVAKNQENKTSLIK